MCARIYVVQDVKFGCVRDVDVYVVNAVCNMCGGPSFVKLMLVVLPVRYICGVLACMTLVCPCVACVHYFCPWRH